MTYYQILSPLAGLPNSSLEGIISVTWSLVKPPVRYNLRIQEFDFRSLIATPVRPNQTHESDSCDTMQDPLSALWRESTWDSECKSYSEPPHWPSQSERRPYSLMRVIGECSSCDHYTFLFSPCQYIRGEISMPDYPLVEVTWIDAEEIGSVGWNDLEEMVEAAAQPCPRVHSVGYLVFASESHISLIRAFYSEGCSTVEKIPKRFIEDLRYL